MHRRVLSRRQLVAAPALRASGSRRSFWGGAFASELDEARAKARRRRLRSFLGAAERLPQISLVDDVLQDAFNAHAPLGVFASRDQLRLAVDDARERLGDLQTAALKLELAAAAEGTNATAVAPLAAESAVDEQSKLAHRQEPSSAQDAAAAAAATMPGMPGAQPAPLPPPDEDDADDSPIMDTLSEEEERTLVCLRTALALDTLPSLWDRLPQVPVPPAASSTVTPPDSDEAATAVTAATAPVDDDARPSSDGASAGGDRGVALAAALEAASALSSGDPKTRLDFHLQLSSGLLAPPTLEETRAAAAATVSAAAPLTCALLERSDMLSDEEGTRLAKLRSKQARACHCLCPALPRRRTRCCSLSRASGLLRCWCLGTTAHELPSITRPNRVHLIAALRCRSGAPPRRVPTGGRDAHGRDATPHALAALVARRTQRAHAVARRPRAHRLRAGRARLVQCGCVQCTRERWPAAPLVGSGVLQLPRSTGHATEACCECCEGHLHLRVLQYSRFRPDELVAGRATDAGGITAHEAGVPPSVFCTQRCALCSGQWCESVSG